MEIFRKGTKKNAYLDKFKALDPFKCDSGEIPIVAVIMIVLGIVIGAILTGAIAPTSIGLMVNATVVNDTTATGFNGSLAFAPSATKSAFGTIPVMYSIALFSVPVVVIMKYLK